MWADEGAAADRIDVPVAVIATGQRAFQYTRILHVPPAYDAN